MSDELLLTIRQTCHRLAYGRTTVYRLIAAGELDTVGSGRSRRVLAHSVENLVEHMRTQADASEHKRTETVATQPKQHARPA